MSSRYQNFPLATLDDMSKTDAQAFWDETQEQGGVPAPAPAPPTRDQDQAGLFAMVGAALRFHGGQTSRDDTFEEFSGQNLLAQQGDAGTVPYYGNEAAFGTFEDLTSGLDEGLDLSLLDDEGQETSLDGIIGPMVDQVLESVPLIVDEEEEEGSSDSSSSSDSSDSSEEEEEEEEVVVEPSKVPRGPVVKRTVAESSSSSEESEESESESDESESDDGKEEAPASPPSPPPPPPRPPKKKLTKRIPRKIMKDSDGAKKRVALSKVLSKGVDPGALVRRLRAARKVLLECNVKGLEADEACDSILDGLNEVLKGDLLDSVLLLTKSVAENTEGCVETMTLFANTFARYTVLHREVDEEDPLPPFDGRENVKIATVLYKDLKQRGQHAAARTMASWVKEGGDDDLAEMILSVSFIYWAYTKNPTYFLKDLFGRESASTLIDHYRVILCRFSMLFARQFVEINEKTKGRAPWEFLDYLWPDVKKGHLMRSAVAAAFMVPGCHLALSKQSHILGNIRKGIKHLNGLVETVDLALFTHQYFQELIAQCRARGSNMHPKLALMGDLRFNYGSTRKVNGGARNTYILDDLKNFADKAVEFFRAANKDPDAKLPAVNETSLYSCFVDAL